MSAPGTAFQHLRIFPLTPHLGAEVFGANLANPNAAELEELHRAFLMYGVLVIRDQVLDREQHKAFGRTFGRTFGPLHVHPTVRYLGRGGNTLLQLLYRHIETGTRFQCRVRWMPGTLTLWDNRCTQHHAIWDYYPNTRLAERVTVAGTAPPAP